MNYLCALSPDAASKLNVLGHDCHAFCVDGTQVGILEQSDQVGFGSLLQSQNGVALEPQVRLQKYGGTSECAHDERLQITQYIMLHIP